MKGFFRFGSPVIELILEGRKIEVLLDTGFNGHIMLPHSTIEELGLENIGVCDYTTASGERIETKVYIGKVGLLNEEIDVPILSTETDFSLAGMELFNECKIVLERSKDIVEVTMA